MNKRDFAFMASGQLGAFFSIVVVGVEPAAAHIIIWALVTAIVGCMYYFESKEAQS